VFCYKVQVIWYKVIGHKVIIKLKHSNELIANQIYAVFQNSYKVEAQLICVLDFPPLSRDAKNILHSKTDFYGFIDNNTLAAVIEIEVSKTQLNIHSLVVDPKYFRKGIADTLINYVLITFDITVATVETAIANKPAIHVYEKHGFREYKRWIPSHGIEKLAMSVAINKK